MTKEKFLDLSTEQITEEIISDVYECSLNTGIDYVDSAYMYFYNLNDIEDLFGLEEITEWKEGE